MYKGGKAKYKLRQPASLSIILYALLSLALGGAFASTHLGFRDDFDNLNAWKPFFFSRIERHSRYAIDSSEGSTYLVATSENSASGIVSKKKINIHKLPFARWKWKIDRVYLKGDARYRHGDDYPIRIYFIFEKGGLFNFLSPPRALNYIWANKEHEKKIINNAYTDRSKMIVLESGNGKAGKWIVEERNVLEDFRKAFGKDPPEKARIGIMIDSDDTGESSRSFVDYIEVFGTASKRGRKNNSPL